MKITAKMLRMKTNRGDTMLFDEQCKVIISTMNATEASAFVKFLRSEIARHQMDIDNAEELIDTVIKRFNLENQI